MVDALQRLRAGIQADIDDYSSEQGSFSREVEASLRSEASRWLHDAAAITGSEPLRDAARRQEDIARRKLAGSTWMHSYEDVDGIGDAASYLAHLAVQSAPTMAQFAGGALAGGRMALRRGLSEVAGRTAGGVAATYPTSTGAILSAQDEQAGRYDPETAFALGIPHAAVSALGGVERFITRGVPQVALRSRTGRAAAIGTGTAVTEGGEEFIQQGFEELGRTAVDPSHDILGAEADKRFREAFVGGAALGFATGGVAGAVSRRPADPVVRPGTETQPVTPPDDSQPRDLLREFFGQSPRADQIRADVALRRGQGELFRPSEMAPLEQRQGVLESFGTPPVEPTPTEELTPAPEPVPEQGDMLAGTAVELTADLSSEITRAQVALENDFSQESLIRELRPSNNNRADNFVVRLAADLSRALREDPEQAVDLLNDLANRPNSVKRNNVLRRAAELVEEYESRRGQLMADAGAARQLIEQQATKDRADQARRESRPGARVTLPEPGTDTEAQIRERNRQQALEEELPEATRRGEESVRRQSTEQRRRLLKDILDDPETQNPTARFIRALRRAGHRRGITEAESRIIRRFEEVRDAFSDLEEPSAPNELTPEVTGIPERAERRPQSQAQPSRRSRILSENFELEPPPSTDESFDRLERAAARRARRRGEAELEPEVPTRDRRQGEMFTPKTGQPTRAAQGAPPQRRGAAFQLDMFTPTGRVAKRPGRSRFVPEEATEVEETPAPRTRDRRQLELFTPTGRPTRAAQGLPPQRRRRLVEPAFEAPAEAAPETEPTPETTSDVRERNLQTIRQVATSKGRAERSVERALDRGIVDFEEGQQLYQLLDEGRVDEVNRRLAQAHRAASGQTRAAPTPTAEASRRAEAQARAVEQRDRTVDRTEDPEDEGDGGPEELRFSEQGEATDTITPTTPEALSNLRELFGSPDRFDDIVRIHATEQDAINSGAATEEDFIGRVAQGFAKDGQIHLIAENIPQGRELAVFLHEVGGHLGLKSMIGNRNHLWVRQQVEQWAERNDDSVEARVGRWVRRHTEGMSETVRRNEVVAYAIEGLVNEGVTPETGGAAGNMFRRIWAAVKRSLRRLGFKNPDQFTGQDLVNLAFGAADLELRGQFHGTAADFRSFDNRYMGSGEGNQAFGWGTYLADRRGTAEDYRRADSVKKFKRQDRGNLLRTVTTVKDEELLRWDEPFSEQSEVVKRALQGSPRLKHVVESNPHVSGAGIYLIAQDVALELNPRVRELKKDLDRIFDELSYFYDLAQDRQLSEAEQTEYETETRNYERVQVALEKYKTDEGPKLASQLLDSLGIKGNKFYDLGSRNVKYDVFFDGKKIAFDGSSRMSFEAPGVAGEALYHADGNVDEAIKELQQYRRSPAVLAAIQFLKDGRVTLHKLRRTYNYVIFNDRNIVRVNTQPGGDPTRMRFSEASTIPIESARNEAEKFGVSLRTTLDDYTKKGVQMMAFGRDLRDLFERALPSFRGFFDTLTEKQAVMLNMGAEINNIMNDAQPITGEKRAALNSFLMRSTKSQAWGFKPDWMPDAEVDPEMQREFNKLSPEAKEIARRVFRHGHDTLQRKNAVVQQLFADALKEVDEENISDAEKKKLKARIMRQNNLYDETFRGMKGPYAPLERFGNYVTVAKSAKYRQLEQSIEGGEKGARAELDDLKQDPDHYAVFFSDTMGDAEVKRRELQATGKFDLVDRFEKEAFYKTIQEAPWTALLRLKNMVSELATDSDRTKQLSYINSLLRDLYLASLSEASARKHDLKRQNIEGADPDMMRAFAAKGKADAHFIAALMHNGKIIKAMNAMRSEAAADTTPGGVPKADRRRALNEALHRHAQSFEWDQSPIGGLQDKAMALTSFWFLATSPRYYIQNLLQVPMVSLPTMAGRFGMAQSWGQLQRAYRELAAGFGDTSLEKWKGFARGNYDIDALRIAPDERAMLERLRDTGLLDVGMQFDMGYWESTADTGISSKIAKVNHTFRTISRQVEVINRVSTALAAYRLQRQRTPGRIDPETRMDNDAYKLADSMVSQTHGDYSQLNKPRLLQSIPRLFTQFRTYQLIQLSLVARYAHNAFKGADPETRAIGRRTLAYILGQHAVVTGALGLPAVQAVAYVMALAFGPDDEPADGERFLRRIIGDDTYTNFLLKGVPAGMGLDVSKYIGMGDATSIMPFTDVDLSSREGYAETAVGLLGPFVSGVAPGVIDGMNQMRQGNYYKGLEATMPSGIRAGMRALRLATDGQSNRRGDQLLSPDEISAFDIAAQALNFETTKLQELRRKRSDLFAYEQYYKSRAGEIKSRYTRAARSNDRAEMQRLREEWRNLQAARRRTGFKVQPLSNLTRAPAEQRKRERQTRGGIQFNKGNRRFVEELTP